MKSSTNLSKPNNYSLEEEGINARQNESLRPALPPILQDIIDNQAVSDPVFYTLVTLYALMIIGSVLGNVLVIIAVLKSPNMRKVNNILIVNLAISDLFLCTIVSPLTLVEILFKRWMGPKAQWLCHLSAMGPVCITFVSTLTITGIAIDRYKIIVYSATNRSPQKLSSAIISLVVVWTMSILLSFPLFFAMNLKVIPMPEPVVKIIGDSSIAYCAEEWGQYEKGRLVFSCFSLVVQFILPITLISWAHHAIKQKLQKLPSWSQTAAPATRKASCPDMNKAKAIEKGGPLTVAKMGTPPLPATPLACEANNGELECSSNQSGSNKDCPKSTQKKDLKANSEDVVLQLQNNRLREKIKKQSRTHALLVSIVVVFALSWFPLNMLNITLDIHNIFESEQASRICFAICHLIGMSSAFSNPILYGWFNEAFRDEFQNIAKLVFFCSSSATPTSSSPNAGNNDKVHLKRISHNSTRVIKHQPSVKKRCCMRLEAKVTLTIDKKLDPEDLEHPQEQQALTSFV